MIHCPVVVRTSSTSYMTSRFTVCMTPELTRGGPNLTRLALDVLSWDHRIMICALDNFFFDPSVVPVFFAIDAMLALVGTIIATL